MDMTKYENHTAIISNIIECCGAKYTHFSNRKLKPVPNFCPSCGQPIKERWENEVYNPFKESMLARSREDETVYQNFKNDLFIEYGVENNPKREKAFAIAWERGHSSGFSEVEIEFSELVELIK